MILTATAVQKALLRSGDYTGPVTQIFDGPTLDALTQYITSHPNLHDTVVVTEGDSKADLPASLASSLGLGLSAVSWKVYVMGAVGLTAAGIAIWLVATRKKRR